MAQPAPSPTANLAEKRRILQLETLYDLALALTAKAPEEEQIDELLQRVCSVVDPGAAVAVTRDAFGGPRAAASVGWADPVDGAALLADPLWQKLVTRGASLALRDGELAGRGFRQLLATPLAYRGVFLGYLAVLDKETRGSSERTFSEDDSRFLDSVAALAGVALDSARQVESLSRQRERLEEENKALRDRLGEDLIGKRFIAQSPQMQQILSLVERVAPRGVNILVRGESGTGKELIARLAHLLSGRRGTMVAVNCAAIPLALLESELFGIEGGVATGVRARAGKFELADTGTLFLDEIGDMEPSVQAKLLRALQEREVVRVGGARPIPVDVRVIAATHQELEELVERGRFREDLFYRLKGVDVLLPPLKDRRDDIPFLVRNFAEDFCRREGIEVPVFRTDATALLLTADYPGNVRELRNLIEGAISLSEGEVDAELLRGLLGKPDVKAERTDMVDLATVERRHIVRILEATAGNKSAAARILGLDRRTLLRKGF